MGEEHLDFGEFTWLNQPGEATVSQGSLEFVTAPFTDFWQRTHMGVRRNNGHAFLTHLWSDFSFSVRAEFSFETPFDHCGVILYIDEENWAKFGVEFIDEEYSRLGSVVTNGGFSDWAGAPFATEITHVYFRLSRNGSDFRFDYSRNGREYNLIRVFHMHGGLSTARTGVFACSPSDSSFGIRFRDFTAGPSLWRE